MSFRLLAGAPFVQVNASLGSLVFKTDESLVRVLPCTLGLRRGSSECTQKTAASGR